MNVCPECGSKRVFYLRIDSDWCYGVGTYEPINDKEDYTDEEWNYDACNRPDIDLFHCRNCHHMW